MMKHWTREEEQILLRMRQERRTNNEIAEALGRTLMAVAMKINRMQNERIERETKDPL